MERRSNNKWQFVVVVVAAAATTAGLVGASVVSARGDTASRAAGKTADRSGGDATTVPRHSPARLRPRQRDGAGHSRRVRRPPVSVLRRLGAADPAGLGRRLRTAAAAASAAGA